MSTLRQAAQQALEALESLFNWQVDHERGARCGKAVVALRAALAEPVQKPVAIVGTQEDTWKGYEGQWLPPGPPIKTVHMLRDLPEGTLLYTAPPQRKPLTEEEIDGLVIQHAGYGRDNFYAVARAIERAHGIT